MQRFCASGSPPVTQTWRTPCFATSARIASRSHHVPPTKAYAVSQYWQRSGQPVRRTNTVRQPIASASPLIEWKISVMRRRSAVAGVDVVDADAANLPVALTDHYLMLKGRGLL